MAGANWRAVASSNGWEQLVAFDNKPGFVWTSQNAGTSWNHAVDGNNYKWVSGDISADGSKIIAGAKDDGAIVHISPDAGETWQYNRVVPNTRKVIGYIDDHRAIAGYEDHGPAFDVGMNGLRFVIGTDTFGSNLIGDVSHLWIGQGVSLITGSDIPDAARRQFVTAGNAPTDPTAWPAAPVAFYGNAVDWEAQAASQGFTITGTLTDANDGL